MFFVASRNSTRTRKYIRDNSDVLCALIAYVQYITKHQSFTSYITHYLTI